MHDGGVLDRAVLRSLRVTDRDEMYVLADEVVEHPCLVGPGAVQRVDDRRMTAEHRAAHRAHDTGMVVDDVEVGDLRVRGERVVRVEPRVPELAAVRWLGQAADQPGVRAGSGGREQRHVVPALDVAVGEQGDDELDTAVARRRNGKPSRGDDGDAHMRIVTAARIG